MLAPATAPNTGAVPMQLVVPQVEDVASDVSSDPGDPADPDSIIQSYEQPKPQEGVAPEPGHFSRVLRCQPFILLITGPTAREDEYPGIAEHPNMASKRGLVVAAKNLTPHRPVVTRVVEPESLPALEKALPLPGATKVDDFILSIQFHIVSLLVILGTEDNIR